MGIFNSLFGGGGKDLSSEVDELYDMLIEGLGPAQGLVGQGLATQQGLVPVLLQALGITQNEDGTFSMADNPQAIAANQLEDTVLQQMNMYAEGRGRVPEGLRQQFRNQRRGLKSRLDRSGFQAGDSPYEEALARMRESNLSAKDTFRRGQYLAGSQVLSERRNQERADLQTLLSGVIGTGQSTLPWVNANSDLLRIIAGAGAGGVGGMSQGGGFGEFLGKILGTAAGSYVGGWGEAAGTAAAG